MNVNQDPDRAIDPAVWERRDVRAALAVRDIAAVFRLLQHVGVSQRRIAALTSQSQSEISEILSGRQVMAYDVLARIADGLGIPRGSMGLAYDDGASELLAEQDEIANRPDEQEETRVLLAHVAEVTMGAAVLDINSWSQSFEPVMAPVPDRVGMADVARLESITHGLRALDYQHGGGSCRDAVVAQVQWAQRWLRADHGDSVGRRLHLALADLHNLAGWTSFDVGLYAPARRYFVRALEQAKHANELSLVAKVLYCMGRLHLHRGRVVDALKFFQLGQIAAQESGCELAVAMLCANEAWAYALLGRSQQAFKSIGRAQDEFARADVAEAPAWVRFFGSADLDASIAMTRAFLPEPTPKQRAEAIAGFTRSLAVRGSQMARSRAFELTALARVHLQDGDLDHGAKIGHQAVDLAEEVRSIRVVDRMASLLAEAERHPTRTDVRSLAERIVTLRAA
ncbi:MAG TPA: helix-turn-helix domain-containing protein [Pilimelia sp.]|nr:helix-turn-helix domain-containing protein [Pilimelia sp.]